jgi:hypothetical protein
MSDDMEVDGSDGHKSPMSSPYHSRSPTSTSPSLVQQLRQIAGSPSLNCSMTRSREGKLEPVLKNVSVGERGGLYYVSMATGKRIYLKKHQVEQLQRGTLPGVRTLKQFELPAGYFKCPTTSPSIVKRCRYGGAQLRNVY